jgi:7-cyano-7-deazaguanine synthase
MSGGLDSGLLLIRLLKEGYRAAPLYIRCGLRWENVELSHLRQFLGALCSSRLAALEVVDAPMRSIYGAHWSLTGQRIPGARSADEAVYLPGRNLLLISYAALVSDKRRYAAIALGVLKGNPFGDASARFLAQLNACVRHALRRPIRIVTPLRRLLKSDLIRRANGAPLALTFSCLRPIARLHCGRCNKCAERSRAFRDAGVLDPTRYA